MSIPAEDKPVYCLCNWEDVTKLTDDQVMVERTKRDPECPIHQEAGRGDTPG